MPVLQKIVTKIDANPMLASGINENRPLKVAAYCRVSTDSEDQANSYEAQVSYYTDYISKNPKWRYAGIYADEGITGTMVKKRKRFNDLIKDSQKGKVDLILTKSVSRFARNTVDSLNYVRKLKSMGIGVFFEEQNINSLKEDSEMFIGIYSVIAQTESENISANVKWGIQKRMKDGCYSVRFNLLGYRKQENGEIEVVPDEADAVRKIFNMYLDGCSLDQLKKYLEEQKILTYTGKSEWQKSVIQAMLSNEKYVGDLLFQKSFRTDCISKKVQMNRGEKTRYLVSNNHPAIVDRDTFKMVQLEMARRSSKRKISDNTITGQGKYSGKYALSELLICGECGSHYKRRTKTNGDIKRRYWRCISRTEHGTQYCSHSIGVEETKLQKAICRGLSKAVEDNQNVCNLIKSNLYYAVSGDDYVLDAYSIEKQIAELQVDINDALQLCMRTGGETEKFEAEIKKMYDKIKVLRGQLDLAKSQMNQSEQVSSEISRINDLLENETIAFQEYDDVTVRRLVDCIRVMANGNIVIVLRGGLTITEPI